MPQFAAPPPTSLTAGLVEPAKLQAEREAYDKALNAQRDKQIDGVNQEAEIKKKMLQQTAETQIKQRELQLNEQVQMSSFQIEKEAQDMITGLNEAAIQQKTMLDERIAIATAEYNKKKAIEDMAMKSYQLQKSWYDGEAQLMAQYQAAKQAGLKAGVFT